MQPNSRSLGRTLGDIELAVPDMNEKHEPIAPFLSPWEVFSSNGIDGRSQSEPYKDERDGRAFEDEFNSFDAWGSRQGGIIWADRSALSTWLQKHYLKARSFRQTKFVLILRAIFARRFSWILLGILVLAVLRRSTKFAPRSPRRSNDFDVLQFIDPLIGTAKGGHVFAGANMPYGMVKAVADCYVENAGGYSTSQPCDVIGFSHMHDSGTGGVTSYGNFPLFPFVGCPGDDPEHCRWSYKARKVREVPNSTIATPGYFGIKLANGIEAEMTATEHAALYRFKIPHEESALMNEYPTEDTPAVQVLAPIAAGEAIPIASRPAKSVAARDVQAIVASPAINVDIRDLVGSLRNGSVEVSPESGRMTGMGQFLPSFGPAVWRSSLANHTELYTLYFCVDFDGAKLRRTGIWHDGFVYNITNFNNSVPGHRGHFGAFTQFEASQGETTTVSARVGVSFISLDQACRNGERELSDFDFERTQKTARTSWRQKFINIEVDAQGMNKSMQTAFWSGIYRTMLSPQDYTEENPLWKSIEPYFDSFYCIWDSFRSTHPFLTIVDPEAQTLMIRALLDIYKHEGKLPDCRMSLCKGNTQGGSNADIVIADALLKNLTQGIDWGLAYEAVLSDAEDEPADWSLEGRGNLESWKTKGYVPSDEIDVRHDGLRTRSVSRTLEYAYDDYCIATMAKERGNMDDYRKYILRSRSWRNVFDSSVVLRPPGTLEEFRGFAQPRTMNGTFQYEDPNLCNPRSGMSRKCYLFKDGYSTYEGGSWLYSFFVPHDMAALIDAMGGKDAFVQRLSYFHRSGIADISDEQSFLTIFQYHYAGRPGLSSKQVHNLIPSQFHEGLDGIPGNDDSGSMGSFLAFCMLGFFPNPGQDVYMLIAPFFRESQLTNAITKKTAVIRSYGWDAEFKNIYIQSVRLNGKPYSKNWLKHSFFVEGGLLEITVCSTESEWGTRPEDVPPSLSTSEVT